jgi:hypothetical protein
MQACIAVCADADIHIMTDPASSRHGQPMDEAIRRLEKSIRLYHDMGFAPERAVQALIGAGHPRDQVRARFPDLADSAFPTRAPTRSAEREMKRRALQSAARASEAAMTMQIARAGQGARTPLPPSANTILQRILPARIGTATATPANAAVAATNGTTISDLSAISFQYVPLIQCSFPHTDPGEATTFTRRNGWLELTLSATRRDAGLPYGVPARLLTIYCASEAIRTKSPEVFLGQSVSDFLRQLDVPITRGERGSLRVYANQLLRLIHCAFSIDENISDNTGRTGLHIRQALFAEEAQLWWDEQSGVGRGSSLVLSSVLFQSILERSAPLSTQAIKQLRKSPMDLDVYAWLVHRLYNLNRPSTMTWEQLSGQFGHSYGAIRYFRRFFIDSLKRVQKVYPEAKVQPTETGVMLSPSRPHVAKQSSTKTLGR